MDAVASHRPSNHRAPKRRLHLPEAQRWLIATGLTVATLIAAYQASALSATSDRVKAVEVRQSQSERDRGDILREIQRVEDRLDNVGITLHRVEARLKR